jgi:hypothetical protein
MTKKPKAHEWKLRELKDWNATTFRAYLRDKHVERFGIPYTARNVRMEAAMIRRMIDEHGPAITKAFIDRCMEVYRPTESYPGINFAFMVGYMKERYLPPILREYKQKEILEKAREQARHSHRGNGPINFKEWI